MDYECSYGYQRAKEGGSCEKINKGHKNWDQAFEDMQAQSFQDEECKEYGFYEISQGYRKVPGNICSGGLQLSPQKIECNMGGYLRSLFSFKSILMWAVLGAVVYFGWPIIEAIIIVLPIPDPNGLKQPIVKFFSKFLALIKSLPAAFTGPGKKNEMPGTEIAGYKNDFETEPNSLLDDDDEEEDIGRTGGNKLDYNSDEKDEEVMIAPVQKRGKDVPKLKKPNK